MGSLATCQLVSATLLNLLTENFFSSVMSQVWDFPKNNRLHFVFHFSSLKTNIAMLQELLRCRKIRSKNQTKTHRADPESCWRQSGRTRIWCNYQGHLPFISQVVTLKAKIFCLRVGWAHPILCLLLDGCWTSCVLCEDYKREGPETECSEWFLLLDCSTPFSSGEESLETSLKEKRPLLEWSWSFKQFPTLGPNKGSSVFGGR